MAAPHMTLADNKPLEAYREKASDGISYSSNGTVAQSGRSGGAFSRRSVIAASTAAPSHRRKSPVPK